MPEENQNTEPVTDADTTEQSEADTSPTVFEPSNSPEEPSPNYHFNGLTLIVISFIIGFGGYFLALAMGLGGILLIPFVYLLTPAFFIYGVYSSIRERKTQRKSVNALVVAILVILSFVIATGEYISHRNNVRETNCKKYNVREPIEIDYERTKYALCLNGKIN